ncbi:hypothetical protein PS9374_04646 [Planomonospora sphaerica]|uniref:Uncharacterized protein n=1 Tax=Planomonospora sphaerica TaxID=161355 RepID=A0A171DJH0_9ACTN|nr:hypothetical protein [Planomonospora sphaerica]GAT68981.1 hypothetical protein PS9374_04646 [Planomonospora sphaerica]
MVKHQNSKDRARAYAAAHQVTYQQAQQHLRGDVRTHEVRRAFNEPAIRYVVSAETAAFLAGEGMHGIGPSEPGSLNRHLTDLLPTYACGTCGAPGDAYADTTALHVLVAAYEPDLSPITEVLNLSRHHARCAPPQLRWKHVAYLTAGAQQVLVPAGRHHEPAAECTLTLHPLILANPFDTTGLAEPVLLIAASVLQDHGRGTPYWLNQMEHKWWRPDGFTDHPVRGFAADWTIRIEDGTRSQDSQWIAVRYGTDHAGDPVGLCAAALELPQPWLDLVRDRQELLVLVGPITVAGQADSLPPDLAPRQIAAMIADGSLIAADAAILKGR